MNRANQLIFKGLWTIAGILGLLCVVTIAITLGQRKVIVREWASSVKELKEEIGEMKTSISSSAISKMKKEYSWLDEQGAVINELLKKKNLSSEISSPLDFKEKLLKTQLTLKQLADIQGSVIPEDIGFPVYVGGKIPEEDEVYLLSKQLYVIGELLELLLRHKVEEVVSVKCSPIKKGEGLYEELPFEITVRCVYEDLLEILNDTANTSFLTIIRTMNINKIDENKVEALLQIGIVEFGLEDRQ